MCRGDVCALTKQDETTELFKDKKYTGEEDATQQERRQEYRLTTLQALERLEALVISDTRSTMERETTVFFPSNFVRRYSEQNTTEDRPRINYDSDDNDAAFTVFMENSDDDSTGYSTEIEL